MLYLYCPLGNLIQQWQATNRDLSSYTTDITGTDTEERGFKMLNKTCEKVYYWTMNEKDRSAFLRHIHCMADEMQSVLERSRHVLLYMSACERTEKKDIKADTISYTLECKFEEQDMLIMHCSAPESILGFRITVTHYRRLADIKDHKGHNWLRISRTPGSSFVSEVLIKTDKPKIIAPVFNKWKHLAKECGFNAWFSWVI